MKKLKKIGHDIALNNFVVHQVTKIAGDRKTGLKLAKSTLKTTTKESAFIAKITDAYSKKSHPTYGIFNTENKSNEFQTSLREFCAGKTDFISFSQRSMNYYKTVIEKNAPASGGFVVFAFYNNTTNKTQHLLVLTLNNKDGYYIDEKNLTIEDIKNLDLSKIDVACLINITKWLKIERGENLESKTYPSFVKGNKDISLYFMDFIGCQNKTTSTDSSKKLANALVRFCTNKKYDDAKTRDIKNAVYYYCIECINAKKEISLSAISALINPENPDEFQEFASSEENEVDEIISGDKTILKTLNYVKYRTPDLTVEFNNKLIGVQIFYSDKKNELTIKNVPDELRKQITQ